jgi:uncharacterized protein (DUF342 family)
MNSEMDTGGSQMNEVEHGLEDELAVEPVLRASEDKMQVVLEWEPAAVTVRQLRRWLQEEWDFLGFKVPCDLQVLGEMFQSVFNTLPEVIPEGVQVLVLAAGTPPKLPVPGKIEWQGPYFARGFYVDPHTGAMDYRRRAARTTVHAQELLAVIVPPVEGAPGMDVFGEPIPPPDPVPAVLEMGQNVYANEAGDAFYAAQDGHIRLDRNKLQVDQVYTIAGSVGLDTGNIDHPGTLEVKENIQAGIDVRTTGHIVIGGHVEDANIECGGNLTVRGGLAGAEGKKIRVKGDLHAKYLGNADVEVEGDIVVDREISQCQIRCRGKVSVPQGRIVGGVTIALGGIDAGEGGSRGAVVTQLVAGHDYLLRGRMQEKQKEIESYKAGITRVREAIESLQQNASRLNEAQQHALELLEGKLKEFQAHQVELEAASEAIRDESKQRQLNRAAFRKTLHSDVLLLVGPCRLKTDKQVQGPLQAVIRDGEIVLQAGIRMKA